MDRREVPEWLSAPQKGNRTPYPSWAASARLVGPPLRPVKALYVKFAKLALAGIKGDSTIVEETLPANNSTN